MKIEEAIQQSKPFKSEHERTMINIIYTSNHIKSQIAEHFKPYGITSKQYNVLRILKGADGPKSTSYIKERLIDRMSDASRIVERLYQKKLIEKMVCSEDRRLVDVTINQNGIHLLDKIAEGMSKLDALMSSLSDDEMNQLSFLLDKLRG